MKQNLLDNPKYSPNNFLNKIIEIQGLKNDAALAKALGTNAPVISKARSRRIAIGAHLLLAVHDLTGLPAKELRKMMVAE